MTTSHLRTSYNWLSPGLSRRYGSYFIVTAQLRFVKHEVEFSCISEYSYKLMLLLYAAVVQEALTRREKDSKRKNTERREGPLASAVLAGHWTIKLGK